METILIVDDEFDLVNVISDALEANGYKTLKAYNGLEAINMSSQEPDLILLDIMMPELDGFSVIKTIRDRVDCPIIFLTAKTDEKDIVKGLALGGDDYLTKPFSLKELVFRVKAHLRREAREKKDGDFLRFSKVQVDLRGLKVSINGQDLGLTKKEFEILELLSLNKGQVFSKDQIYDKIWGYDGLGGSFTVTEHIKKIRAKIRALDPSQDYIKTVWGLGYKWEP